ncbi:MAG: hypothetical protein LBT24_01485, partial [Tannerella sp.]|nr:hypothetical protein [Tannerella sp.]
VIPNFKIGESWVSFYLNDIATIRTNDWENLQQYFNIPNPIRTIDFQKTTLKRNVIIPKDLEFHFQKDDTETFEETKSVLIGRSQSPDLFEYQPMIAMVR